VTTTDDDDRSLGQLLARFPRAGRVAWIGVRPGRRSQVVAVDAVDAIAGRGLAGDHYAHDGNRQVTLIQAEHLAAIAALAGRDAVDPASFRRNIAVTGVNLLALKGRRFRIGTAVLEATGPCDPCSRMEEALGPGGLNAVRGHGGITARVAVGGAIRVGDPVQAIVD
jgi:MOSC domain-containing protein YiiM